MSEERKITSSKPIDDVVAGIISGIRDDKRGFILGLAKDEAGKVEIEVKKSLEPHDTWQPPAGYRAHTIEDTASFIRYALRYGTLERSMVFYSNKCAILSIDEEVALGEREIVQMPFDESADWKEWSAMLNKAVAHKELLRFLMTHAHNLKDPTVLLSMQSMKINAVVNVESDIRDDGKTVGLMVKTSAGEELKKFPKSFDIALPVLDQDGTANGVYKVATINLDTQLPDDPKSGPSFTLICSLWKQIKRARIDDEGDAIRAGLHDWTVIHGIHSVTPRKLGGK